MTRGRSCDLYTLASSFSQGNLKTHSSQQDDLKQGFYIIIPTRIHQYSKYYYQVMKKGEEFHQCQLPLKQ